MVALAYEVSQNELRLSSDPAKWLPCEKATVCSRESIRDCPPLLEGSARCSIEFIAHGAHVPKGTLPPPRPQLLRARLANAVHMSSAGPSPGGHAPAGRVRALVGALVPAPPPEVALRTPH